MAYSASVRPGGLPTLGVVADERGLRAAVDARLAAHGGATGPDEVAVGRRLEDVAAAQATACTPSKASSAPVARSSSAEPRITTA